MKHQYCFSLLNSSPLFSQGKFFSSWVKVSKPLMCVGHRKPFRKWHSILVLCKRINETYKFETFLTSCPCFKPSWPIKIERRLFSNFGNFLCFRGFNELNRYSFTHRPCKLVTKNSYANYYLLIGVREMLHLDWNRTRHIFGSTIPRSYYF